MDEYRVDNTGMIDTDITFNPKTMSWFFVIDGNTWTFIRKEDAEYYLAFALRDRKNAERDYLRTHKPLETVGDDWLPQGPIPPHVERWNESTGSKRRDPEIHTNDAWALICWAQVEEVWADSKKSGYDRDEVGEILYDLVEQLVSGQGSD